MEWTEDAIARLRLLWDEGHSTAEIGRRMGISKNAVVGKAHRLELPPRPSPIRREGQTPRTTRRASPRRVNGPTLPSLAGPSPAGGLADSMAYAEPAVPRPERRVPSFSSPPDGTRPAMAQDAPGAVARRLPPDPMPRPVAEQRPAVRPVAISRSSSRLVACCWPIGEPGTPGFRFCDGEALTGKPYCGDHAALAYVKVRDRREEAA